MTSRGIGFTEDGQNYVLPNSSPTPLRSEAVSLADEFPKAADAIRSSRRTESPELEAIANRFSIAGYFCQDDMMDTSVYERPQLFKCLSDERPSWVRTMRKLLDSQDPPKESEPKTATSYKETDIFAAIHVGVRLRGVGGILRPRQNDKNLFSQSL